MITCRIWTRTIIVFTVHEELPDEFIIICLWVITCRVWTRTIIVFTVNEELPDEFIISVEDTFSALRKVKTNKSTGPDNIPEWVLKEHANSLAAPLTSIFNCSYCL